MAIGKLDVLFVYADKGIAFLTYLQMAVGGGENKIGCLWIVGSLFCLEGWGVCGAYTPVFLSDSPFGNYEENGSM